LKELAAVDSQVLGCKAAAKLRAGLRHGRWGLDHASGEFILAMDGDQQHNPKDIPKSLKKLEQEYDNVSSWRKGRIDNLVLTRIPSRCANWLMVWLSGLDINDFATTSKTYPRQAIYAASPIRPELPPRPSEHSLRPASESIPHPTSASPLQQDRLAASHSSRWQSEP